MFRCCFASLAALCSLGVSGLYFRAVSSAAAPAANTLGPHGLPDLDRIRAILERIQAILTIGGMTLAIAGSLVFLMAWVFSHLRRPKPASHSVLSTSALWSSYVPVAATIVAAVSHLVPLLGAYTLKAFAFGVLAAAFSWCLGVAAVIVGGQIQDLQRARRALLLAGTPWYCLAAWISTLL